MAREKNAGTLGKMRLQLMLLTILILRANVEPDMVLVFDLCDKVDVFTEIVLERIIGHVE